MICWDEKKKLFKVLHAISKVIQVIFHMEKKSNLRPKNYSCIICCYFVQSEKKSYLVIFGWNLEKKKIQKVIVISKLQFFKQNYTRDCKNYHLFFGIDGGKFLGQGLGPKWLFSDKTRSKRM